MSKKTTINLEINTNADEAAKEFENLSKATEVANDSLEGLNKTFEEANGDIQPLTARMGEAEDRLYELALAGDTASKEYQGLLTKVGEYRKVQIQTDLAVDGAATTIGQKLGSALNGATSGFAATQGAMALFGSENDALEKSLLKVQSALAIQQGVQGLTESYRELGGKTGIATKAQAAFNFVMNLNPIILIVTGITLAIAALAKFTSFLDPAIQGLKDFGDAIGLTDFAEEERAEASKKRFDEENVRIQKAKEYLEKRAKQEQAFTQVYLGELELRRRKAIQDGENVQEVDAQIFLAKIFAINKEKKTFLDGRKLELKRLDNKLSQFKKHSAAYNWQVNYNAEFRKQIANEEFNEVTAFNQQVENLRLDDVDKDNDALKTKNDNYRNYAAERLSIARQIEDIENGLLEDGIEKELEINEDKFRRLREDAKKNTKLTRKERARLIELFDEQELAQQKVINQKYVDLEKEKNAKIDEEREKLNQERIDKEDALFQLELDLMKDRQLAEIIALSQGYEEKYLLAQDNAELTKQLEAQFLLDQAAIEDKFRLEKLEKDKEASDKQKELIESERQARLEAIQKGLEYAQQGADAIQQIGDLVFSNKMSKLEEGSKEEEELARKQFKFNKALQLGGAIIDAGKAITASLASAPIAIGPVPNPAGIASLAFAATTSAVNIAKIAATQFESTGGPADTPDPNISDAAAPNFNVVGDSGINQIAALQSTPVQAFVVSGEVTTSQALDRNRVQNATL